MQQVEIVGRVGPYDADESPRSLTNLLHSLLGDHHAIRRRPANDQPALLLRDGDRSLHLRRRIREIQIGHLYPPIPIPRVCTFGRAKQFLQHDIGVRRSGFLELGHDQRGPLKFCGRDKPACFRKNRRTASLASSQILRAAAVMPLSVIVERYEVSRSKRAHASRFSCSRRSNVC